MIDYSAKAMKYIINTPNTMAKISLIVCFESGISTRKGKNRASKK